MLSPYAVEVVREMEVLSEVDLEKEVSCILRLKYIYNVHII